MNTNIAEFVGAMIGDGCLSLVTSRSEKRIRKTALLTGHLKHDHAYYERVIRPIIQQEFQTKGYIGKRLKRNCVYLVMGNNVFDFLKSLGFPIGRKLELQIPIVIMQNPELAKACVRGIFDTDGSIYRRYSKQYKSHTRLYDYLVIQFKMDSEKTIMQIKEILTACGIETNKIIPERESYVLRITKQDHVKKFMEIIRPSNTYHVERYINRCMAQKPHGPLAQLVEHPKLV